MHHKRCRTVKEIVSTCYAGVLLPYLVIAGNLLLRGHVDLLSSRGQVVRCREVCDCHELANLILNRLLLRQLQHLLFMLEHLGLDEQDLLLVLDILLHLQNLLLLRHHLHTKPSEACGLSLAFQF